MSQVESQQGGRATELAESEGGGIRCDSVRKEFMRRDGSGQSVLALEDVSLEVRPGEFLAIVGPSGCGKSTLLRLIAGLASVTSGRIFVGDRESPGPGPDRGFVFQSDALLPWRTIRDNVMLGLELMNVSKGDAQERVEELLQMVGLSGFEERYPHELSGGMRQRANLTRALAVDPKVLLMDEPFGSLDAQTRELMQAELLRIWSASKKTVLFVTHQIEEAVYLADRVALMSMRPSKILTEITIELERPRDPEIRYTPKFTDIVGSIWDPLRDEVLAAFEAETVGS